MKNVFKTIAVFAASLLAFGACQGELENPREQVEATHSVTFVAGAPETKTAASVDEEAGIVNYAWTEDDANQQKNKRFHVFENGNAAKSVTLSLVDGVMNISAEFYGEERPADAKYTGYFNSGVLPIQAADGENYDQDSDVLIAKETTTYENGAIPFQFKRLGAIAEVTLKGLTGAYLYRVTIESTDGAFLAGPFNEESGELVGESESIMIDCSNIAILNGEATLRFVSIPVPAPGARLRFIVETLDSGVTHKYAKSFAEGASIDFSQGDLTPFSVAFGEEYLAPEVTFSINGSELTDPYAEGEKIKFYDPEETISGFTFVGWTKTAIDGTQDNAPELVDTDNEVMGAESMTYYAVYATKTEGTSVLETVGFEPSEGYTATTTYNSPNYTTGTNGSKWTINYGAFSSSNAIIGNQSAQFRVYASGGGYGELKNTVAYNEDIVKVSFSAKAANSNGNVKVSCSANGLSWTDITTLSLTTTATEYTVDVNANGVRYVKFTAGGTKPSSGNYSIFVDGVAVSSKSAPSYSNYCTTVPEPATLSEIKVSGTPAEFWKGDEFNHNGITVTATWSDGNETDVTSSCDFTGYDMSTAGQQTVTVTYEDKTCTYTIEVKTIANTEATAYTVTEAKALIDDGKDLGSEVYVKGKVSKVEKFNSDYKSITYWLDNDSFEVYGGLAKEGEEFTSIDDIKVDADVIVKGKIKKFGSTYELDQNNHLVSYTAPAAPKTTATISLSGNITSLQTDSQANVVTITYNGDGELSAQSSNTGVATVSLEGPTLTVTPVGVGSTTITVSAPETDNYTSVIKSYTLNVSAPAQPASLPFEFNDGKSDIDSTNGMSQSGLGSDYSASPKLKFDTAGDNVIINFNEAAKKVTYTIKGNSTSGTYAFDVMESADGVNYFTVHSHTSITDATTYTDDLASTSRFVKFVYTTKANGNVALGNIKITSASVTKYTLTINSAENGSIKAIVDGEEVVSGAEIEEGKTVTITATPADSDHEFDSWSVTGATVGTSSTETFTMTGNVTVGATFKEKQGGGTSTYTKVTAAPSDWSGTYVIAYVNETSAFVYNGTDSGANNGVSATITSNSITGSDFVEIEIAAMSGGYSLKIVGGTNNGKYLSGGTKNGTTFGTTAVANSISLNTDGTVKINNNTSTSFQFNSDSNQQRFRYFASSQKGVTLFKK